MRPLSCNYYVTLRCNDSCEFCPHWRETPPQFEASLEEIKENLRGLKTLGVYGLDINGGEPLLRDDLPEILAYAKELKLFTNLTTNGMLFPEKAAELAKNCDRLMFSLDFPDRSQHDASRGEEIYDRVLESLALAKSLGKRPVINFTLTRESVRFLPEMEEFAEKEGVLVWLNLAFESPPYEGLTRESIDYVKYFFKKKKFAGSLAMLELLKNFGNNPAWPICRAARAVLTITPDNFVVAPCYFNPQIKIKIDRNLERIFNSAEYQKAFAFQGKSSFCAGCLISNYLIPSGWFRLSRYFFLNLYSALIFRFKEYLMTKR